MTSFLEHIRDFNYQWTFVVCVMYLAWCLSWVRVRFGLLPSLLLCFSGLSTMWVWVFSENRYFTINAYDQMGLKFEAADSFGKLMAVLLPLMALSPHKMWMRASAEACAYLFVLLNSIWIIYSFAKGCYSTENACGGMIGNPSIGVSLMVAMLPIFIYDWRKQWKILLLAAFSTFASKSSIAVGLFAVYGALTLLPKVFSSRSFLKLGMAGAFASIVMVFARLALGKQLFNDSERFHIWRFMMERWAAPWNIPFGTGLGTYHVFSINLQDYGQKFIDPKIHTNFWWNTLHNEPLQFLFECGIVGLILFLATYFIALKRALSFDFGIAMSIVLYGLYMTLDPALHHPIPALFGAWLFTYTLRKQTTWEIA